MGGTRILLVTDDPPLAESCCYALAEAGPVEVIAPEAEAVERPLDADVILFDLGVSLVSGVALLGRLRTGNPHTPVVLLGRSVPTDLAVELVILAGQDFVSVPCPPDALGVKVGRLAGGAARPGRDAAGPTPPTAAPPEAPDPVSVRHRTAFRATVPDNLSATFHLPLRSREIEAAIVNLSLETDGVPGAMLVRFVGTDLDSEAFRSEELVAPSAAAATLPDGHGAVDLSVLPIRVRAEPALRRVDVVFQYRPLRPVEASRIARFWMQCQARVKD